MAVDSSFDLLQIPGLVVTGVKRSQVSYLITAEPAAALVRCPKCGSDNSLKRANKSTRTFRDTTIHDKKCRIEVRRRGWRCAAQGCLWRGLDDVPGMEPSHSMTRRLATQIKREALRHPFRRVAADVGCNEALVRRLFHGQVQLLDRNVQFETPEWMGIDEVHIHRKYICVITNLHRRTVVAVLEEKSREGLFKYIGSIRDRERVRLISTDMDEMYRAAASHLLPRATIVLDRFHLVARATQAVSKLIEDVRRELREGTPQDTAKARKSSEDRARDLGFDKWALLKRSDRRRNEEIMFSDVWTRNEPQLGQACALLQGFYGMWEECQTPNEAQAYFAEWRARVKQSPSSEARAAFQPLLKLFASRPQDIFSYFGTRLTNAYTEQANRRIRDINRAGRGYNFAVLRAKILYGNMFQLSPRYERPSSAPLDEGFDYWAARILTWQQEREERFPAPPEHIYRQLPEQQKRRPIKEPPVPPLFSTTNGEQLSLLGEESINYGAPVDAAFGFTDVDEEVA